MSRLALASFAMLVAGAGAYVACTSSSSTPTGPAKDGGTNVGDTGTTPVGDGAVATGLQPAVPCTDSIASVYGDPGSGLAALDKGAIIRCAHDVDISVADLQARVNANVGLDPAPSQNVGYTGKPLTSGVHIYRVLYRTERGDTASSPGYSSAEVLIPDSPRAAKLPILVASHGSRGQAGVCTASQENDAGFDVNGDYEALGLPLAGLGYAVILPDLAGYSNFGAAGNPPSAYAHAQDVGKSTLDGARALTKFLTTGLSDKVVMVGHSQGGHTAFSSVAIAPTYAPELNIAAAAAYSPLWLNQASWGALLFEASSYPIATNEGANGVSVWYHYTHAALMDGPDAALETFSSGKGPQVAGFEQNDCWGEWADLEAAGTILTDIFDPAFASSVARPAALGIPCASGDTTCATWLARYAADRPHFSGTTIPFLIEYGAEDQTIDPGRISCVTQRLQQDSVNYTFCLDPRYGHTSIVRAHASDVADWIAAQTLGEAQPPPCQYSDKNLVTDDAGLVNPADDGGTPIVCTTPPPNN